MKTNPIVHLLVLGVLACLSACSSAPSVPASPPAPALTVIRARRPLFSISYDSRGSPTVLTTQAPTITRQPSGLFRITFDPVSPSSR